MNKLWITYAWSDNCNSDVDFIITKLKKADIDVQFDRKCLVPGERLWPQIAKLITDPNHCDAWAILLTPDSVRSEPCIEELTYALDRALTSKERNFPIFALLHNISIEDVPPALKVRLCIPLNNENWISQVEAAIKNIPAGFMPQELDEIVLKISAIQDDSVLEIRPRFSHISPFGIYVPLFEKSSGNVYKIAMGPSGIIPTTGFMAKNYQEGELTSPDGTPGYGWQADNPATPNFSYYLFYKRPPRHIWFGNAKKRFHIEPDTF